MKTSRLWKVGAVAALAATIGITAAACAGGQPPPTTTPTVAQNLIVMADTVTGSGGTLKNEAVCVLQSQYKRGNHITWRVKVYDPATGEPMDDTDLESVVVELPDGQTFEAEYGGHPAQNSTDHFWATSWVVPEDYPTGSLPYEVTARATDGRTGQFDRFNVAPSLLMIVE